MKKNSNTQDFRQQDGHEQSKKLYRSVSESARQLDEARHGARVVSDLFTPSLQIQRGKFRDYCERLIFADPVLFGRKAEELLWRKAYYDVISTAKKLKKKQYTAEETCNIEMHINAGVGHYYHFISRLQYEFDLDLRNFVDFPMFLDESEKTGKKEVKIEKLEWAKLSVHRCLVYLGDLNRYKLEIYPNWDSALAIRYYLRAIYFDPDHGIPHNQMGFIAASNNRFLDATYHYMRCLLCKYPFEGTENNLQHLFEKNQPVLETFALEEDPNADCIVVPKPSDHIKRLLARFLFLAEVWVFNKKIPDVYVLCHQTNTDLRECLTYLKPVPSEIGDTPTELDSAETESISSPSYLTDDAVFKIVVICLMCISKAQKNKSDVSSTATAFTFAVYSQLIQVVTDRIYENIQHFPIVANLPMKMNGSDKKQKIKVSRRRKKKNSSESDLSDPEIFDENSLSDVDISDVELCTSSDNESDEEQVKQDSKTASNTTIKLANSNGIQDCKNESVDPNKFSEEMLTKSKQIDVNDLLEIISEEKYLSSIKILSEWLASDTDSLKSCGKTMKLLLKQVIQLLNLVNVDFTGQKLKNSNLNLEDLKDEDMKIALPEDICLRNLDVVTCTQKDIKWDYISNINMTVQDETVLRIHHLLSFGRFLTKIEETGVSYDSDTKLFTIQDRIEHEEVNGVNGFGSPELENNSDPAIEAKKQVERKTQLHKMKHMGQLWLAEEVRTLENRVKGRTSLSPYLVVDVEALTEYAPIVKHLVNSKRFIVVVPSIVVSALDDLKLEKSEARDTIRWLEAQFHRGNRFCRAQRAQERAPLPFVKYPKKKDKEMYTFIQIIECCHCLAQQQKGAVNLVTLLLGNESLLSSSENREISYDGLARSVGINMEFVTEFYEKWKKNFKGKR